MGCVTPPLASYTGSNLVLKAHKSNLGKIFRNGIITLIRWIIDAVDPLTRAKINTVMNRN